MAIALSAAMVVTPLATNSEPPAGAATSRSATTKTAPSTPPPAPPRVLFAPDPVTGSIQPVIADGHSLAIIPALGGHAAQVLPVSAPSAGAVTRSGFASAASVSTGSISGTVSGPGSAPLSGVCVYGFPSLGGTGVSATTGADGTYALAGLAPGRYVVEFTACSAGDYVTQYSNDATNYQGATPVAVTAGAATPGINAILASGGAISGTVTDGASNPIAGLCVMGTGVAQTSSFSQTDTAGRYTLTGLPGGAATVQFGQPGCGTNVNFAEQVYQGHNSNRLGDQVPVAVGSTTTGINTSLQAGGTISGTVTDSTTGHPISGCFVGIQNGAGGYANTDTNGNYTIAGLATGSYLIGFSCSTNYGFQYYNHTRDYASGTYVRVIAGAATGGISDALIPGSGSVSGTTGTGGIAGAVTDTTGAAIPSICVSAHDGTTSGFATTDASGNYSITGLSAGSYTVEFYACMNGGAGYNYAPQWYSAQSSSSSATPVAVADGTTATSINATMQTGAQIIGTVSDGPSPVPGMQVSASGPSFAYTATLWSGHYLLSNLASGAYTVQASPSGVDANRYGAASAPGVTTTVGGTAPTANLSLSPGGSITGLVTDASGFPLPGVQVTATNGSTNVSASTDGLGGFAIQALAVASYTIHYTGSGPSICYSSQYYNGSTSSSAATPVSVQSGTPATGVNATLTGSGSCNAPTATSLTSSPNPSMTGSPVSLTATVTPTSGSGTVSGQVEFLDGTTALGFQTLDPTGVATLTTSSLGAGTHQIRAIYQTTPQYASSSSAVVSQVVHPLAPTSTALTSGSNPSTLGQVVTFTAAVSSTTAGIPTGTVTFKDGTTTLGAAAVGSTATATLAVSTLAVGSHQVSATYGGDVTYAPSTSSTLAQTVNRAPSTSQISSDVNPALVGVPVTFTVHVTASPGPVPTGQVALFDGTTTLGTATLDNTGTATLSTSTLAQGSHQITVSYPGDLNDAPSTSTALNQSIVANDGTTLLVDQTTTTYGQPVGLTATVAPASPGPTPTGTVDFYDGTTLLGVTQLDPSGSVAIHVTSLSVGAHQITAKYEGDGTYHSSTSNATQVTVNQGATQTVLGASSNPATTASPVTLTATVAPSSRASHVPPAGQVTFMDGSATLGAATVDASGVATLSSTFSTPGDHSLTAVYGGSAGFATSSSPTYTLSVVTQPTGLTVTVTDTNNNTLSGASVFVASADGRSWQATTDNSGSTLVVGLPDGSYHVSAYAQGYKPAANNATVAGGAGLITVALPSGPVGTSNLTASRLTPSQLQAIGIDPNAPGNSHVYQFTVSLAGVGVLCGYTNDNGFISGPTDPHCSQSSGGNGSWSFLVGGHDYTLTGSGDQVGILDVPGVHFLKEFFDIKYSVLNLADAGSGFNFTNGSADLTVPAGLTFMPSTLSSSTSTAFPDVPGQGTSTVDWVVRGDTAGYYNLSATYAGLLQPFGAPINLAATTAQPIHVWGADALRMVVQADNTVYAHYPYRVRIGLQNVADTPVYNGEVGLAPQIGTPQYIFQPKQTMTFATAEIDPGTTWWTGHYELLSPNTNPVSIADSFVTKVSGDVNLAAAVVGVPPFQTPTTAPSIVGVGIANGVQLQWAPIAGATSYEIFTTPTDLTPFSPNAVATLSSGTTSATLQVPGGTTQWYAVTPVVGGHESMVHPMVQVTSLRPTPPVFQSPTPANGTIIPGKPHTTLTFSVAATTTSPGPVTLTATGSPAGATFTTASGNPATGSFSWTPTQSGYYTITIAANDTGGLTSSTHVNVQVSNGSAPSPPPPFQMAVLGDSVAWGQGLLRNDTYASLLKDEIQADTQRPVTMVMLAHSGARLTNPTYNCDTALSGEIPFATPDISGCQLNSLQRRSKKVPIDLVLINGCINDLGALPDSLSNWNSNILFGTSDIPSSVRSTCLQAMETTISAVHKLRGHPKVVITGYYPIVSQYSDPVLLSNALAVVNPTDLGIFTAAKLDIAILRNQQFNTAIASTYGQAIKDVNGSSWATYVDPGFTASDALFSFVGGKLWEGTNDDVVAFRADMCGLQYRGLLAAFDRQLCKIASMGHPNRDGAQQYETAILNDPHFAQWLAQKFN